MINTHKLIYLLLNNSFQIPVNPTGDKSHSLKTKFLLSWMPLSSNNSSITMKPASLGYKTNLTKTWLLLNFKKLTRKLKCLAYFPALLRGKRKSHVREQMYLSWNSINHMHYMLANWSGKKFSRLPRCQSQISSPRPQIFFKIKKPNFKL